MNANVGKLRSQPTHLHAPTHAPAPKRRTPATGAPTALVIEGGAMRGIFAAGVTDAFLDRDFCPFDLAIGTSAGASNLLSYLAGQRGRTRRCFLDQMSKVRFIDPLRFVRGGHWMDLDWLWETITREDPLDVEAAARSHVRYALVATSAETGHPLYLSPSADDMLLALKGSCAMPIFYRGEVRWHGEAIVDGAISDPLPVREAYRRGARRIVVIRSREATFVRPGGWLETLSALTLHRAPGVARAVRASPALYADGVRFIHAPPADCEIIHVAPAKPLLSKRTTRDRDALLADYELGYQLGADAVRAWSSNDDDGAKLTAS